MRDLSLGIVCLLLVGCASTPDAGPKLPFHVAVAPVVVPSLPMAADASAPDSTAAVGGLQLSFDSQPLTQALVEHLGTTFARVSLLPPATADGVAGTLGASKEVGADLILKARLFHEFAVDSSLNDRFWLNLLLHALGGPFGWFVPDRTYTYQARLEVEVFDATSASAVPSAATLAATGARVLRVERQVEEASLNFLDRADGVLSWSLGMLLPAGLVSSDSDAVVPVLRGEIARQLATAIAQAVRERAPDLMQAEVAAFCPEGVRTARDEGGRALVGEMVVDIGQVDELGALRYRFDAGEWHEASWTGRVLERPAGRAQPGRRRYAFRIPVEVAAAETVQLEVEQVDRSLTRRTFTYSIAGDDEENAR